MSEQGGALAGLRAAMREHVEARESHTSRWDAYMRSSGDDSRSLDAAEKRRDEARIALDAELAAVEARLDAYRRFVRASDAYNDPPVGESVSTEAIREFLLARAAITAEDIEP